MPPTVSGRPRAHESAARRREFIRLLFAGVAFADAARAARVKPIRALAILDELEQAGLLDVSGRSAAA